MQTIITSNGLNIIGQNSGETTAKYWIGYFGLAYVPDELRSRPSGAESVGEYDELKLGMTQLTTLGDNIYNLFQGSMKPEGLDTDIGESAAGKLYNECMYTANVMSRYRYVLDEDDNNQLIVLESHVDPDTNVEGVKEYDRFIGTKNLHESELPIPAPLYYQGEPVDYPSADIPDVSVSCDTRDYSASDSSDPGPGAGSDSWDCSNKYGWAKSDGNVFHGVPKVKDLQNGWQFQSVSNYNRFHAPANSAGYAVGYEPACRNISTATKLFPIGHYDVLSTKNDEKVAKVQYTVDINMKSVFTEVANRMTKYYDKDGNPVDRSAYKMSFKFNRVGIYAVPVALHAYTDSDSQNKENCANYNVQMQITGTSDEPILFAVMDLDSPVIMSEDGCLDYKLKFNVDYSVDDSGVVDSTSIFYNLYEDDAITWYKNQLIANASAANAITSLGVQMNYLRKQMNTIMPGSTTGCIINDTSSSYSYTTHGGIKNIKDVGSTSISDADAVVADISRTMWWGDANTLFNLPTGITPKMGDKVFDSMVFLGKYGNMFADKYSAGQQVQWGSDWIGIGKDMTLLESFLKAKGTIASTSSMLQPYNAPMVFTGGISLGGHGNGCTYGLMKIGSSIKHATKQSELLDEETDDIVSVQSVNDPVDPIQLNRVPVHAGEDDHFVVHSPHAGKVLTVLDDQELDGTLHIGLKKPQGGLNDTIIIQDDGVILPLKGLMPTTGWRNILYISNVHESVDAPNKRIRFSVLKNGEFTTYDKAADVLEYNPNYGLRPGQAKHIVWNTWYSLTANNTFGYDSEWSAYYDPYHDFGATVKSITDPVFAADANMSVGKTLRLITSYGEFDFTVTSINLATDTVTGDCRGVGPNNTYYFNNPGTYQIASVDVDGTTYTNLPLVSETTDLWHNYELVNPYTSLYIITDDLIDGVVYEIKVNIRSIASSRGGDGLVDGDFGGMNAPGLSNRPFYIYMYDKEGHGVDTYMWGDSEQQIPHSYYIRPTFNRVPTSGQQVAFAPGLGSSTTSPVLATAVVYIVKVDGKIYVMGY